MNKQPTYILVHGAWHGAWCWDEFTRKMTARAYQVIAPDLPGHGNAYLPTDKVTFDLYVDSLVTLIKQQPEPVILVGHSMAGMIISQVAEFIPEKIAKLIYLAAFIPENGNSLLDLAGTTSLSPFVQIDHQQKAILLKNQNQLGELFYPGVQPCVQRRALSMLQAQPFEPFTKRVKLTQRFLSVDKEAIFCEYDKIIQLADQKRMSRGKVARTFLLSSDHSPFFSSIDELMARLTI